MLSPELNSVLGAVSVALLTYILSELRVRNAVSHERRVCESACDQACRRAEDLRLAPTTQIKGSVSNEKAQKVV